MNLSEFKAWFEGFTENLSGPPNAKAWARIQAKIKTIKDAPAVTHTVFRDCYERPWRRWFDEPRVYLGNAHGTALPDTLRRDGEVREMQSLSAPEVSFNSGAAFAELGRAEAKSLKSD